MVPGFAEAAIPAKAGIHFSAVRTAASWTPAFAGVGLLRDVTSRTYEDANGRVEPGHAREVSVRRAT